MISPGHTVGVLGGGPVGPMLTRAAQTLGYRVHAFDPANASAGALAGQSRVQPSFDDVDALKEFARHVDVVTCVSGEIPSDALHAIAPLVPLHPKLDVVHLCAQRQRKKAWLRANGFPQVRYAEALDGDIASVIA